ncbi:MAG: phospho-sugar mutase [Parachlamydiales bacterium]|jgi:phosphoglucomutase/phosphomannomutase
MILKTAFKFDTTTENNIQSWLQGDYDDEIKDTIHAMLNNAPEKLVDAFYTYLSFGTGGMRGLMGIGTNRMNVYTIRAATQGLANYILKQPVPHGQKLHRVMIGFDSRTNSTEFAQEAAKVLAANGIEAHIFKVLHPTPLVSFGCRYRNCTAAIMITASHNPSSYNGYKVYWNDGAQVLPPHDEGIIAEVQKVTSPDQVKKTDSVEHPLILEEGADIDIAYLAAITPLQLYPETNRNHGSSLNIIYSPLHGTGITTVPETLKRWGFTHVELVKEQALPNGLFPTVQSPNPEEPAAMQLGVAKLLEQKADIFLATDPDADRVGLAVNHRGQAKLLTGNQIACICLYHVLEALHEQKRIPSNAACVKTLPTTELFTAICQSYNVACFDVLTGFKYIAQKIREWESDPQQGYQFIFGGEDSYGYLLGTHARDKDAAIICALIAEAALHAKRQKKTLIDMLDDIYEKYGPYEDEMLSIGFPETKEGREKMINAMGKLRSNPPTTLHGHKVLVLEDYTTGKKKTFASGNEEILTLPKSDVLIFRLENNGKLIVRPSGTEPKIKIYVSLKDVPKQEVESLLKEFETLVRKE